MNQTTPPDEAADPLEQILDAHAEYYIRQTMKFFQENGESPALSKNNEGDLVAKAAIEQLRIQDRLEELSTVENYPRVPVDLMSGIQQRKAALLSQLTVREQV